MSKIAMHNGQDETSVADLSDEQVHRVIEHLEAGGGDDGIRERVHAEGHEDERAFVAAYARYHEQVHGHVFCLP